MNLKTLLLSISICLFITQPFKADAQRFSKSPLSVKDSLINTTEPVIPNAFTPNGDGKNDYFKVYHLKTERLVELRIFNKWGSILFHSQDPQKGWDGTYKGKDQPIGVYGYLIKIEFPDGSLKTYKGTLTLLR